VTPRGAVELHDTAEPDDEDLLQTAAVSALTSNAEVYFDADDVVPAGARAAGLLRW
jgi:hypothetical protein